MSIYRFSLSYYSYHTKIAKSIIMKACMKHLQNWKSFGNGAYKIANTFSNQPSWTYTIMLIDKQISNGQKKEEKSYSSYDGHCSGAAENSAGVRSHVEPG